MEPEGDNISWSDGPSKKRICTTSESQFGTKCPVDIYDPRRNLNKEWWSFRPVTDFETTVSLHDDCLSFGCGCRLSDGN